MKILALLMAILSLQAPNNPTLKIDRDRDQTIWVSFPANTFIASCTVFLSPTEKIEQDGKLIPYAPRHCWGFESSKTFQYTDDWAFIPKGEWIVYAELQRESDLSVVKTNEVRVQH